MIMALAACQAVGAQVFIENDYVTDPDSVAAPQPFMEVLADSIVVYHLQPVDPADEVKLPAGLLVEPVYMPYEIMDTLSLASSEPPTVTSQAMKWIERERRMNAVYKRMRQNYAIYHPDRVKLNFDSLPAPPKVETVAVNDPTQALVAAEISANAAPVGAPTVVVERQNWINRFKSDLQFSQAYISPNWYQGGNSSLNLIFDFRYDTQLNTKFHPDLMFENNFQWRTALTNAPEDEYRNYSITENRLQINSKFGYRAFRKWYYSLTGQFKTPVFNSYRFNSDVMTASFLSPGELNVGLGMTYSTKALKDKFELNLTISPLSYNLKTVINNRVSETAHGLEAGHKTLSSYGSSFEMNWKWKICYNVSWQSRFFFFTDYKRYQYDWQNSVTFNINKYLTANFNLEMRYDTTDKVREDTSWHRFQMKELISLGFTYNITH